MTVVGQKLKICATKTRAANKRRVAFLAKIATRWIYFIHIFRQLLVPNLSKSEKKVLCSRLALITLTRSTVRNVGDKYGLIEVRVNEFIARRKCACVRGGPCTEKINKTYKYH